MTKKSIKTSTDQDVWLTNVYLECLALLLHWIVPEGLTMLNNKNHIVKYNDKLPTVTSAARLVTKGSRI